MKQTEIETAYSAQLLHRIKLEVLVDRNPFLKTAKALCHTRFRCLAAPDRVIK
jgi:hypothetical protein